MRALRRSLGLTQGDVAHLLGFATHSQVSRLEGLVRDPDIRSAFAYEFVLGAPTRLLFATIYSEVTRVVSLRAHERLSTLASLSGDTAQASRLAHLSRLAEPQPTLFGV